MWRTNAGRTSPRATGIHPSFGSGAGVLVQLTSMNQPNPCAPPLGVYYPTQLSLRNLPADPALSNSHMPVRRQFVRGGVLRFTFQRRVQRFNPRTEETVG